MDRAQSAPSWLDQVMGRGHIVVRDLTWLDCEYVAFHMRAIDKIEIYNNIDTDNEIVFVGLVMQAAAKGMAWVATFDGRPAGVMGIAERWPGSWEVFAFGTEDFKRVLVALKPPLERAIKWAKKQGCHRIECRSHITHVKAHRLIRLMEFQQEGVLRRYGKDGNDYLVFSRLP